MSQGLVYHQGGLGDFVLSLPAILRMVSAYPDARWHFWGPAERLALLPGFLPPPAELLQAGHTLWGDSPDERVTGFLSGCEAVLAFGGRSAPRWPALSWGPRALALSAFPEGLQLRIPVHQSRQLDALGVPKLPFPTLDVWRTSVLPVRTTEEIVLHAGSGDTRKNLPLTTWRAILSQLKRKTGSRVRLVLGPVESERGHPKELREEVDEISVCGTSAELLAALSRAALFLGNDSGATHLAGLLGIPTVVVFGPSDPSLWSPLGPAVRVVRASTPCAPCTNGGPFDCRCPRCLDDISAREVVDASLELVG